MVHDIPCLEQSPYCCNYQVLYDLGGGLTNNVTFLWDSGRIDHLGFDYGLVPDKKIISFALPPKKPRPRPKQRKYGFDIFVSPGKNGEVVTFFRGNSDKGRRFLETELHTEPWQWLEDGTVAVDYRDAGSVFRAAEKAYLRVGVRMELGKLNILEVLFQRVFIAARNLKRQQLLYE